MLLAFDREEYPVGTADLLNVPNLTYDGSPSANRRIGAHRFYERLGFTRAAAGFR